MFTKPGRQTGPRTADGKARSARNAIRHGMAARKPIIQLGEAAEFQRLDDELCQHYRVLPPEAIKPLRDAAWRVRYLRRNAPDAPTLRYHRAGERAFFVALQNVEMQARLLTRAD